MTNAPGWNLPAALVNLRPEPWRGRAWRFHRRRYGATDAAGSHLVSGRYHRAADRFPESRVWAALYLALGPEVALGEILRRLSPEALADLNDYRLSELEVGLAGVLDCRDASAPGMSANDLVQDNDFSVTQDVAAAAIAQGVEGILVPSATQLGDNLVIFPDQLRSASRLVVVGSRDPLLYVRR